jgi:very-short-patch-repair endonuclease/DNA-directed RNA polymerase subunit RPC12/RpoP
MAKRKTNKEYLDELRKVWGCEYTVLTEYVNQNTKIKVLHTKCGNVYETYPMNLVKGHKCGYCSNRVLKSNGEFLKELKETSSTLIPLDKYQGANQKIDFRCSVCGNVMKRTPSSIINKHRKCGYCSNRLGKKEKIKRFLKLNEKGEYIFVKYGKNPDVKTRQQYIWFRHQKCGTTFCTTWYHFVNEGTRCPHCKESKGERAIYDFLSIRKITFVAQKRFKDCRNRLELPFDFYLPEKNICIEYDGEQHFDKNNFYNKHRGFEYREKNDQIKNEFCKKSGIRLIRIKYNQSVDETLTKYLKGGD